MRGPNRWWILVLVVVLLAIPACTENNLDDSEASVILEILGINNPPVSENTSGAGTCTGNPAIECLDSQICADNLAGNCDFSSAVCSVKEWSVNVLNAPLNANGTVSPFNDIIVSGVVITYTNVDGMPYLAAPSTRSVPISATIPAGSTGSLTFFPIAFNDIGPDNTTVNLALNFIAQTVSGEAVGIAGASGEQLFIEDCIP